LDENPSPLFLPESLFVARFVQGWYKDLNARRCIAMVSGHPLGTAKTLARAYSIQKFRLCLLGD